MNLGVLHEKEKNIKTELGLDWVKVANDWKLRIIGLTSASDLHYENNYHSELANSAENEYSQYTKDTLESEHIIRATYGKTGNRQFKPEFGVEIANNSLKSALVLIANGIIQALEAADVVEELRGEIFINFVYRSNDKLSFEGGLTAEFSNIKSYSNVNLSQTFTFIKPRLSANYTIRNSSTLL